jgi:hypothetical protein
MGLPIVNGGANAWVANTHANSGANLAATGWFYEFQEGAALVNSRPGSVVLPVYGTLNSANTMYGYGRRWLASPIIWTNHYRVNIGSVYANQNVAAAVSADNPHPEYLTQAANPTINPATTHARVQLGPTLANDYTVARTFQFPWDKNAGGAGMPSYPSGFSRAEYRNSSLKLTNPSLSAMNALKMSSSVVYYPFQYFFSQAYHVTAQQNPWGSFTRWNTNTMSNLANNSSSSNVSYLFQAPASPAVSGGLDLATENLKIQQMIQMPANPCTSLIIGIYREKDRRYLAKNATCSYSPVLFWQALNPLRAVLYDGGNILFDYASNCSPAMYSLIDRPDVLRIPFRGGLCQVDPANMLPSPYQAGYDILQTAVGMNSKNLAAGATPSTLAILSNSNYRWRTPGEINELTSQRYRPIHCTEQYESTLLEFPFVMHEPLRSEATVQSTPSFAKTLLRLEFWIHPLLKPPRGLDDMYSLTTNPGTSTVFVENIAAQYPWQGLDANNHGLATTDTTVVSQNVGNSNISLMVPDCHHLATPLQPMQYSDAREASANNVTQPNPTMPASSSSWNINNEGLLIHVTFMQNQVWQISPLRTSILAARG